jgi:hypothetical protein
VGRNAAIKNYDSTPAGQPLELLPGRRSRLPVIVELLASPWIVRASELVSRDGSSAPKHVAEDIDVEWDAERGRPLSFERAGKHYRIDAVLQTWSAERSWWDSRAHVSVRYWRVLARGGVYDLAFDRTSRMWRLVGVQD